MIHLMKKISLIIQVLIISAFCLPLVAQTTTVLTLKDAILLSLRHNPTVQSVKLDRITQKYALFVEKHAFYPQYTLNASFDHTKSTINDHTSRSDGFNVTPKIDFKTHFGTALSLSANNPKTIHGHYNPTLTFSIKQPLIRGFGRTIVDKALNDALDNEEINKLSLKNTAISTINIVISQYLSLIQAKKRLKIDQLSLEAYERTLKNDKAKIKAGQMARNDIIQTQAQLTSQKAIIQNDRNNIDQARLNLLNTLGLNTQTPIKIPENIDLEAIITQILGEKGLLTLDDYQRLALKNNISYQQEGLTLKILERALITAKDNHLWSLDVTAQKTLGGGIGGGENAGINSLFNGNNQNQQVNVSLSIPIDDVSAKQTILNAKIALDKAKIAYRASLRKLEIDVINYQNTILSNQTQLDLSKQALKLQRRTVEIAQLKNKAGRISTFELLNNQRDLTQVEQNVIDTTINYILTLTAFDQFLGTTLDHWGLVIRT